ncbi:protein of unknown function [Taphrina deformans PYCC 5710]|uniref:Checkpoint protein n=1 Tax=Taphrina deformans (strain PYCC 5710 / ATCC 11124 / CBS 356.35 / IMI 108563 / JCM 9778 / NBRC 8474) TaxID=1097556 RepID=R4XGX8_TAPDE|nr:protein of unknown function [Taphrina deformans PYCC 5710]|eukprot:CCG85051.1 protein of unknown function [Taphrina deformans PYCC 5710]
MKFKSTIVDIPTLTKISQSLALLSKQAWIRLTPDRVHFIVQPLRTQVYVEIDKESMFTSYIIESNAENVINLELNVDSLGRLLRNLADTGQVSMKLTKRDRYPMLSFSTQYFGKQGGNNTVTHDLHVRVLSSAFIAQVSEPIMPVPDVIVLLPALAHLSQISAPLRSLSDKLVLRGNMNGEFAIGIRTPAVSTSTLFQNLTNPQLGADEPGQQQDEGEAQPAQARDKMAFCTLKVDAKDWCNLLRIGSVAKRAIACFCEGHALVLYVYLSEDEDAHNSVITYYIATFQE